MGGFAIAVAASVVAALVVVFGKRIWAWKRVAWKRWQERGHPERLRPPTVEQLQEKLEADAWGERRYRAESIWNADEVRAYLYLRRRDAGVQSYQVEVREPARRKLRTNPTGTGDRDFLSWYPDDFRDAPKPPIAGDYEVTWFVLVQATSGPQLRALERSRFCVP